MPAISVDFEYSLFILPFFHHHRRWITLIADVEHVLPYLTSLVPKYTPLRKEDLTMRSSLSLLKLGQCVLAIFHGNVIPPINHVSIVVPMQSAARKVGRLPSMRHQSTDPILNHSHHRKYSLHHASDEVDGSGRSDECLVMLN